MSAYRSDFLNIMAERGFVHQCSDFAGLDAKLMSGVQRAYIGFDATASSLHVGSLVQIMSLYWFQQSGHRPITLMGGGTTKIGDPSGKDEGRQLLDDQAIAGNIGGIQRVFAKFLRYGGGETDALMVNNDDWLKSINYISFLRDYGVHFTINRMLTFDSVKLRLDREQPLTFLEFNYMILQAYDFVELYRRHGVILQMGGSDQWGNIINGVDLWRRTQGSIVVGQGVVDTNNLFALTTPLLTTASGAKMGKTAAGAVWLNSDRLSAYDYYQYWRNTEDADVVKFLKLFTTLPLTEIARLGKLQGQEINDAKKVLAFEATKLCHGAAAAAEAQGTAQQVFEQGGVGGDLPSIDIERVWLAPGVPVIDLLVKTGLAPSKGEARRLIQGGGVRVNDAPVSDAVATVSGRDVVDDVIKLSAGKKRHALVRVT